MTIEEAWEHVKDHESGGNIKAIGDQGRAIGAGQMWAVFRLDYWPQWAWELLEALDYLAFRNAVRAWLKLHPRGSLRSFYLAKYNPHATAVGDLPDDEMMIES